MQWTGFKGFQRGSGGFVGTDLELWPSHSLWHRGPGGLGLNCINCLKKRTIGSGGPRQIGPKLPRTIKGESEDSVKPLAQLAAQSHNNQFAIAVHYWRAKLVQFWKLALQSDEEIVKAWVEAYLRQWLNYLPLFALLLLLLLKSICGNFFFFSFFLSAAIFFLFFYLRQCLN